MFPFHYRLIPSILLCMQKSSWDFTVLCSVLEMGRISDYEAEAGGLGWFSALASKTLFHRTIQHLAEVWPNVRHLFA